MSSCGELSADIDDDRSINPNDNENNNNKWQSLVRNLENPKSQLSVIFDVIGTPSEQDLTCVDSATARLLLQLQPKIPKVGQPYKHIHCSVT